MSKYQVDSKAPYSESAQYGYPYAPGAVTMPSMPDMPGTFADLPSTTSARDSMMPGEFPSDPKPRHAHTFPLTSGDGAVPYPTSSHFPDPNQYDLTGARDKTRLEDSLAFGMSPYPDTNSPYPDPSRSLHNQMEAQRQHESGYGNQYQPPNTFAPSPYAFYGAAAASTANPYAPEPHRTMSNDFKPQPSHTSAGPIDPSKFYGPATPAPMSHLSPTGAQEHVFVPSTGRPRSSSNLSPHMDRLAITGGHDTHGHSGGVLPPPSPLLEAYRGTYQSVSPMVAPMASLSDSDMSDLEPLSGSQVREFKPSKSKHSHSSSKSDKSSSKDKHKHKEKEKDKEKDKHHRDRDSSPKAKKHAMLYDSTVDAAAISKALSHSHASNIDTTTITRILPSLTHDQMLDLRGEYKKIAKVNGKGINLSKHLKLKLSGNYGKIAHVCALGRWESEGYWANFFYQSHSSRRELLIESLMGRSNAEIRAIKDGFRDKRYSDDLEKMVSRELRADKFRTAVGWVLEARRQEETEVLGDAMVKRDVGVLSQCLRTKEGGESAMLEIVVRRSDAHLREVLKVFERDYKVNFAREALKRSGNLVGEVLAHILNGVINRPARDALLLRHAIQDIAAHNHDEELRYELLISRMIRFHWDRAHLDRVKREYLAKNRWSIEHHIGEATKGDLRMFLLGLCEPRG